MVKIVFLVIQDQVNAKPVMKVLIYRMDYAFVKMDFFTIQAAIYVSIVMRPVKLA